MKTVKLLLPNKIKINKKREQKLNKDKGVTIKTKNEKIIIKMYRC